MNICLFVICDATCFGLFPGSSSSSSSSLSCDRSTASSKLRSPKRAILSFLLQLPVSSCFLKVTQQLLTSPSSPCYPSNLSLNNVFLCNIGLSHPQAYVIYCCVDCPNLFVNGTQREAYHKMFVLLIVTNFIEGSFVFTGGRV
jgi:hypothetical protein